MHFPVQLFGQACHRPRCIRCTAVQASYGGANYRSGGYPGGSGRPGTGGRPGGSGGLIIPGQQSDGGYEGGRLVVPGEERKSGPLGGGGVEGERSIQNFRPPSGFMDLDPSSGMNAGTQPPEVMLQRLRGRMGKWHDLARLLPPLLSNGYDSNEVEAATDLEKRLQGIWGAALPVYDSLKSSSTFPQEKLSYFDVEGAEQLLFEIRLLTAKQRADVAEYIVDNQLAPAECQTLARAVKEHERRRTERDGFTFAPGDVLAFKHYRDAIECRKEAEKLECIERGLAVATSATARRRLQDLAEDKTTTATFDSSRMLITMLRLLKEEMGARPIAVAGTLDQVYVGDIFDAPVAEQRGAFGQFTTNSGNGGMLWVTLPAWQQLLTAEEPVALEVPDCSEVPLLVSSSFSASDDDRKRLATPGMLVLERRVGAAELEEDAYYAVPANSEGRGVRLVEGRVLAGSNVDVCGKVLFCARPPAKEASKEDDPFSMLSL